MVWIGFRNPNRFWLGTHPRNLHIAWCCCKRLAKYLPCEVFIIFGLLEKDEKGTRRVRCVGLGWPNIPQNMPKTRSKSNGFESQKPFLYRGTCFNTSWPIAFANFPPILQLEANGWNIHIGWPSKNSDSCHQVSFWSCRCPMHWSAAMHPCSLSFSKTWSLVVQVSQVLHSPFVENCGL